MGFIREVIHSRQDVTSVPLDMTSNAPTIIAVNGFFTGFTLLVVFARIYVRTIMLKTFGTDDYVIVAAMLCGVGVLVCFIGETHHGQGMHTNTILTPELIKLTHWNFFHSLIVTFGISLVKISIGFFLLRLITERRYRIFCIGMIVFLILFTITSLGTIMFACIPVDANWDFSKKPTSKCYSMKTFTNIGLFNSSINIVTDVVFACLPIPIVWNLHVNIRTRISLIAILSLGFFACAAAIVKTVLQAGVFDNPDYTFHDSYSIWNNVELHVGIIAACLPALRPLFAALLDGAKKASRTVLGSSSAGRQHRYYIQNDSAGGIKMSSLNVPGVPSGKSKYDVKITTRSHPHSHHTQTKGSRIGSGESEEELKVTEDRDSDEIFIMNNGQGIMKSVDVTVQR